MNKIFDKDVAYFTMRLHPDVKARLSEHAQEIGLSFAAYVRMILTERAKLVAKGKLSK
jgi:predicted HicB family RNase H-like nuclease